MQNYKIPARPPPLLVRVSQSARVLLRHFGSGREFLGLRRHRPLRALEKYAPGSFNFRVLELCAKHESGFGNLS